MKVSVTVLTHRAVSDTTLRHKPFWDKHGVPILFLSPEDAPVDRLWHEDRGHLFARVGQSSHSGLESNLRIQWLLRRLEKDDADFNVIYEYDSLCLDVNTIRFGAGFFGNVQQDCTAQCRFMTMNYANPPWIIDRESVQKMVAKMAEYPLITEEGFHDRYLSALAFVAGVPLMNHIPHGHTQGTIDWSGRWNLVKTIARGGRMIHGIKFRHQLQSILEIYLQLELLEKIEGLPL
jgi:hypothetical protein